MFIFVDTSAWLAIVNKKDKMHLKARHEYVKLLEEDVIFVTTDYVLSETLTRIRYDTGHREAVKFYEIINDAHISKSLIIQWIDPKIWHEAWQIFGKYADQKFSVTDCTSFITAKNLKIKKIFAFDEDFKTMGFWVVPD